MPHSSVTQTVNNDHRNSSGTVEATASSPTLPVSGLPNLVAQCWPYTWIFKSQDQDLWSSAIGALRDKMLVEELEP